MMPAHPNVRNQGGKKEKGVKRFKQFVESKLSALTLQNNQRHEEAAKARLTSFRTLNEKIDVRYAEVHECVKLVAASVVLGNEEIRAKVDDNSRQLSQMNERIKHLEENMAEQEEEEDSYEQSGPIVAVGIHCSSHAADLEKNMEDVEREIAEAKERTKHISEGTAGKCMQLLTGGKDKGKSSEESFLSHPSGIGLPHAWANLGLYNSAERTGEFVLPGTTKKLQMNEVVSKEGIANTDRIKELN